MWTFCTLNLTSNAKSPPAIAEAPNLWYAYPWGYAEDQLGVRESNSGSGGKHETYGIKMKKESCKRGELCQFESLLGAVKEEYQELSAKIIKYLITLTNSELEETTYLSCEYIVTNMECRFPAILVLWLGREFYRG
ncbi:hypothetical protein AVEN_61788-1 [Araneus ventricosus]|uniref:Uncharacterized protein n=1 Tax=Araneus ventricosus TaxID=182803 RepID=A0A4Y2U2S3_ARAVE|nr:hypothetical protein AVEN_61788-1 [Araneus ventricosus]